ncbi:MAG: DUF4258 domain-containing protein [bacterium]
MDLKELKAKVKRDEFVLSYHAHEERQAESISIDDIKTAILNGEILESYPEDKRGKSCLVFGYSNVRPIHIVCGQSKIGWLKIITVYIPEPPKWVTPSQRGKGGK